MKCNCLCASLLWLHRLMGEDPNYWLLSQFEWFGRDKSCWICFNRFLSRLFEIVCIGNSLWWMSISVLAKNHVEIHVLVGFWQFPSDATVIIVFTQSFNICSLLAAKTSKNLCMLLETIIMWLSSLCSLQLVVRSVPGLPQVDKYITRLFLNKF